jgi:hypothetical protein
VVKFQSRGSILSRGERQGKCPGEGKGRNKGSLIAQFVPGLQGKVPGDKIFYPGDKFVYQGEPGRKEAKGHRGGSLSRCSRNHWYFFKNPISLG